MGSIPNAPAAITPMHVAAATFGREEEIAGMNNTSAGAGSVIAWVAKLVTYMPICLPWDYHVKRVWWVNGSTVTSGNVDMGVYSADGVRIYNTGSTAQVGVNQLQYVTPGTDFMLIGGTNYYVAWTCDSTTSHALAHSGAATGGIMYGLLEETTGSFGLPATFTPVTYARAWGYVVCGFTRTASGF